MKITEEMILSRALSLTVSSPEDLMEKLHALHEEHKIKSRYISLALNDHHILVRLFSYKNTTGKELESDLLYEAADLLSMTPEDVVIDYQVFPSLPGVMEGFFICAPQKLIRQYLSVIDKAQLTPVKITSSLLAMMDAFILRDKVDKGRFCLIDFSQPDRFYFSVIKDRQCEFLRKVKYENFQELKQSVIRTLQGACASSLDKNFDRIFLLGRVEDEKALVEAIRNSFATEIEWPDLADVYKDLYKGHSYYKLNLLRNYVLSPGTRKTLLLISYSITLIMLLHSILLAIEIRALNIMTRMEKTSFEATDYDYALGLGKNLPR